MRRALLILVLASCAPEVHSFGGLTIDATASSFAVKSGDKVLLESVGAPVSTRQGRATYEMQFGAWKITDNSGAWSEGSAFTWSDASHGAWSDASKNAVANLEATSSGDGVVSLKFTAANENANRFALSFKCEDADRFLGFGAQADAVDHHGHLVAMWTSEPGIGKRMEDDAYPDVWFLEGTRHASSYGLPTWLSNRGYQGLVESDARSIFDVCQGNAGVFRVEVWAREFTLHVYAGPPKQAVERATAGPLKRPVRPPPLAFAPWNDAIYGSDEVRRVAKLLRDSDIPSSVIWTEDFRGATDDGTGYRLKEEWDLDPTLYPDAGAVAAELTAEGFSWQAYFNTFLVTDTRIAAEGLDGGHFLRTKQDETYWFQGVTFKNCGLADLSRPETREWVKSYLRASLDVGFTGWMADFGEWYPHDAKQFDGADPLLEHNRYARDWAQLNAEVMAERAGDGVQRTFFSRSGWIGSNAVSPVVWAGDQRTDFERDDGMFTVIPMGINLGLAGVNTYGHDIGGYQSNTNPTTTKEVFFRWTTLGALTPVMRTHHGIDARNNWHFDTDAETLAHFRRWTKFHMRLFPFFDGLSANAEATGLSTMRSIAVEFPDDAKSWTVSDEYLLGEGLLVAPVVDEGATSRTVYLPPGDWISWDGQTNTTGAKDISVQVGVSEIALFLKKGTVLPRVSDTLDTVLPATAPLVSLADVEGARQLLVAAGGNGEFTERDGTHYVVKATGAAGFTLPACATADQRGCVDGHTARLDGTTLTFPGGELTISGGTARTYDVEVLY